MKKTEEMEQYEKETGKYAIWRGKITDGFLKWKKGEKIYDKDKDRISFYVTEDTKAKWQEFAKNYNYPTISKLIREAVNSFIEKKATLYNKSLENLNIDALSTLSHSLIENKIVEDLDNIKVQTNHFDILIIEDNIPTVNLLRDYFESKGYSCKYALTGKKGLEALYNFTPKLILLDLILPDLNGFDICKSIKTSKDMKNVPVFYLTAVPGSKVEEKMEETKADGMILKPFNLTDLNFLFDFM